MYVEGMGADLVEFSGDQMAPEMMGSMLTRALREKGRVHVSRRSHRLRPAPELMGFSLTGGIRKAARVVKRNAGDIATYAAAVPTAGTSLLAKKKFRDVAKAATGNFAAFAAAPATGGLSLLGKKSVRDVFGDIGRSIQSGVIRPVTHQVAEQARAGAFDNVLNDIANKVPGGHTVLGVFKKKKKDGTPDEQASGISMPVVLGVGGAVVGTGLLIWALSRKKKGK